MAMARGMTQPIHVYLGAHSDHDLYLVDYFESLAQRQLNLTSTSPSRPSFPMLLWARAGAPAS